MTTPTPANQAPLEFETIDGEAILRCPACASTYVHLDDVYMAGRPREDGPVECVHVDANGNTHDSNETTTPLPPAGLGRRHAIAVAGWCEGCHTNLAIVFKQHKGQTFVTLANQTWTPLTARPF